jgi:hypothetical protein
MRLSYQGGVPSLSSVPVESDSEKASPVTNDQGEYALGPLPAGEYYIKAEYKPGTGLASSGPKISARYTYFPDLTDSAAAAPVGVRESEEVTGIFRIPTLPNIKVSGKVVVNVPGGCEGWGVGVGQAQRPLVFFLTARDPSALDRDDITITSAVDVRNFPADDLPFELRSVPPGSWDLHPLCITVNKEGVSSRTPIEVRDRNIENLTIDVRPLIELSGRIVPGDGISGVALERFSVQMQLRDFVPATLRFADGANRRLQVLPDGSFSVTSLLPGRYSVTVAGLPEECMYRACGWGQTPAAMAWFASIMHLSRWS